eukprot:TRINITY_DN13707_c0_g1_i1.p1 TRINITY_DN13707_c0_g1~~TRINITY_DN13707_c0_g1_i1.p1  ORF type:complete len:174 (-),score=41.54 TRINITY_DN13707_c0_g1_i1:40-561(-)
MSNPRGIPATPFLENIEAFIKDEEGADQALAKMQENHSKYKLMEMSLTKSKQNLNNKIPELRQTLDAVKTLQGKHEANESMTTNFELTDGFYAQATVSPSTVCLWLGANVMVEYTFQEATTLLTGNLEAAEKNMANLIEDLAFLKDQITTTEVNMARVFNYNVKQRRKLREAK